jgi:hypothetical protein
MTRLIAIIVAALALPPSVTADQAAPPPEPEPEERSWRVVGKLAHQPIAECSGIVASRRHAGIFWVHNDSGSSATLYAVKQDGSLVGEFAVAATNEDWEDIATDDDGHLYVGDVGNNAGRRKELVVYRLDEPDPTRSKEVVRLKVTREWTLSFPAAPFDCEALFVHGGHGYVISKLYFGGQAGLYRFSLTEAKEPVVLEKVGSVPVRTPVTAADISPDGKRLAVLSVAGLNVFDIDGDLTSVGGATAAFTPYVHPTMEACTFTTDGAVLVATEPRQMLLFDLKRQQRERVPED